MSVAELKAELKGTKGLSKMRKAELVKLYNESTELRKIQKMTPTEQFFYFKNKRNGAIRIF